MTSAPFDILPCSIRLLAYPSAHQVGLGEVDNFISAPIEDCFDHEQAKALDLVDCNGRRHGEFLPTDNCFNQSRPVMTKCLLDHRPDLIRCLRPKPKDTCSLGHLCEIWVPKIGSKFENTRGLHFQLNKGQRAVVEYDQLHRQLQLTKREQIAHEHG